MEDEDFADLFTPHSAYPSPIYESYFTLSSSTGYFCNLK